MQAQAATYEIHIANSLGVLLDIVDDWLALQYTGAVNEVGELTLVLDGNYFTDYLKVDGRIGVYRNGKLDMDTVWLIRYIDQNLDQNGVETITVVAESANVILRDAIIAYDEGTAQAKQTDLADDLMKAIVRQNRGASASAFRDLVTPGHLTVENDVNLGPSISKDFPYDNVFDVCKEISQTSITAGSAVYFDIVAPAINSLEFRTFRGLRGLDHSSSGVNPVVLAPERGNLVNVTRAYDWRNEKTYIYAGGQDAIQTASSADRIGQSVFGLKEAYINVSGTGGSTATTDEAESGLRAARPVRTFQGELVNVPGTTEYGIHWGLGDKLTAEYKNIADDVTVDVVSISVQNSKETIKGSLRVAET